MCNRTFAHFKERQNVQLHICTFSKSDKKCDHTIAILKWANVQKCEKKVQISKSHLFCTIKRSPIALSKRANVQKCAKKCEKSANSHFFCTFSHICSFQKSDCEITLFSHFFKEQKNVRLHICTFLKSNKMCDCTFAHFQRAKMCDVGMCNCPTLGPKAVFTYASFPKPID